MMPGAAAPATSNGNRAAELILRAVAFHRQGALDEAARLYETVLGIDADHFDAQHMLGTVRLQQGRIDEALLLIFRALESRPNSFHALCDAGSALQVADRLDEAIAHFSRALEIRPDDPDAHFSRGDALYALHRYEESLADYDQVIAVKPDFPGAFNGRGNALWALGRHDEAVASYDKALLAHPGDPALHYNRGVARFALSLPDRAIADFDLAIAIKPDYAQAHYGRGHALATLGRHDEAAASYADALSHDPDLPYVAAYAAYAKARRCDWTDYEGTTQRVLDGIRAGRPVCVPFAILTLSQDPAVQLLCAKSYARRSFPQARAPLWGGRPRADDKIRLAYLSANFHEHAVAYLIAELFELHDRTRFEITGVSFGPDGAGGMRSRLQAGVDRFIDARGMSDADVAARMRDLEVDIAIDLMGFTDGARSGILALRPAPVQVNYLGYPGTMGVDFIDYIIADEFIVPNGDDVHYSERVARLPCFQVNDSKRRIAERTPTRSEAGLPEKGVVFCCFNNSVKINPTMFDVWMRLLRSIDGSVLWLLRANPSAEHNLRREAELRGIDNHRLVFADRVALDEHLARHRIADLFVDTLPYNAHTTASDALWAGLPVLTCVGRAFASRVAGSLLNASNLSELVTTSLAEYEVKATELARNPALLQEVREKLARGRVGAPLFQTDRFRRHIEAAFATMLEIHRRGEKPRAFAVPSLQC